jgi:hypothetical protein
MFILKRRDHRNSSASDALPQAWVLSCKERESTTIAGRHIIEKEIAESPTSFVLNIYLRKIVLKQSDA